MHTFSLQTQQKHFFRIKTEPHFKLHVALRMKRVKQQQHLLVCPLQMNVPIVQQ